MEGHTIFTIAFCGAWAAMTLAIARLYAPRRQGTLPNPLKTTIPHLTAAEVGAMEYRPDLFPGARDVETPYGSMRVYEWGPEDGRKVLLIHGIATSCMTLGKIARGLVELGYRVMLFDLFGRGFSDGVDDVPHDARLYTSQALLALASSPLPWTGRGTLRVVGYSLGGGVAVRFANTFPDLVGSLVLLAPAGLIRSKNFGLVSRFVFRSGLVPEAVLRFLTERRLRRPIAADVRRKKGGGTGSGAEAASASPGPDADRDEQPDASTSLMPRKPSTTMSTTNKGTAPGSHSVLDVATAEATPAAAGTTTPLEVSVQRYVAWMARHHGGFLQSFMSSIRFGPLTDEQEAWSKLGRTRGPGRTMVLIADDDEIIDAQCFRDDVRELVGDEAADRMPWRVMRGGHDFVMTHDGEVLKEIREFWGQETEE